MRWFGGATRGPSSMGKRAKGPPVLPLASLAKPAELMYHTPRDDERTPHIPQQPPNPRPGRSPHSLSLRPTRTFPLSVRPERSRRACPDRSRRAGTQHSRPEAAFPWKKPLKRTPSKMSHCDISPATKMSQMSQCPKICDISRYEKMSHHFRIWPARKMSQMSQLSATKKIFLAINRVTL